MKTKEEEGFPIKGREKVKRNNKKRETKNKKKQKRTVKKTNCLTYWALKESPLGQESHNA